MCDEDVQRAVLNQPVAMGTFTTSLSPTQLTYFEHLESEAVAWRSGVSPLSPETQCMTYYYATNPSRFAVDISLWALHMRNVHFTELSPFAVYRTLVSLSERVLRIWDRICFCFERLWLIGKQKSSTSSI